ncbi:glycoside hydrolase family 9 protein [Echinicola vietnamensis]|uniref:Endoglucanase n=1 Tax=Echinicola vietnamensis (strain DSM 17526 / LMG 23754 / KMM 6221) TaxID=926556 RepID=L0G559_ECHVK|nr:glycoside hydrolase family 9 protein [Echinicola vietnamensis]AGA79960.1 glycosyl hydrolase family 9 [Echinicola vietnamensis DSM 17526]
MITPQNVFQWCFVMTLLLVACKNNGPSDEPTPVIRLNQIGHYPASEKVAIVMKKAESDAFHVVSKETGNPVFEGNLVKVTSSTVPERETWKADFSSVTAPGMYHIQIDGVGSSHPIMISESPYDGLLSAVLKGFYFQRASTALDSAVAGKWARAAGHPDDQVYVHASAASPTRPAETVIAAPKGWYDAGDYNKYIVNSGISMGTMLSLYEDFPDYFSKSSWDIPESSNALPDLLDEILWNLDWMAEMQDPEDGGVYHKLTTAKFAGMVMPEKATAKRYVVQKSTAAALDFAAVMAQAARVMKDFPVLEKRSKEWQAQAEAAWTWAMANPHQLYEQEKMNEQHDPDITTGAYGDSQLQDEWIWAACELYLNTGEERYLEKLPDASAISFTVPSWSNVAWLGYYSLLRHADKKTSLAPLVTALTGTLEAVGDEWLTQMEGTAFHSVMGKDPKDFVWGSNAVAANQGVALIQLYKLKGQSAHLSAAKANLDYLLGRNATGYCFVTGFGAQSPMHPHHRISEADGVKEPIPGLLVGGPNPGQQDGCNYPSGVFDESYVDHVCSYASNEITINWNAPMAYLIGAMVAMEP